MGGKRNHTQVEFLLGMKECKSFNIRNFINIIHHINTLQIRKENRMNISVHAGKAAG